MFLLNFCPISRATPVRLALQYKMFLLNSSSILLPVYILYIFTIQNVPIKLIMLWKNGVICEVFTIQNVPIKFKNYQYKASCLKTLQYKMFLLNYVK